MKGTVLIVDDSEAVRTHVRWVLHERHVFTTFLLAGDGVEGFKMLLQNEVDLVLCDLMMPGIDGFKFLALKKSKPEYSEVPVIMITGEEDVRAKVRGLDAGASDYLTKPFHDEELVARVKVHLKIKALQDELLEKNQRLEELSRTDGLTKIANRRHFMETLELEFLRAERYESALAYIMIDLDHFKALNDKHGHQAGDKALLEVARILQRGLRQNDMAGRYGGEEFALMLPQTDLTGATVVAERCRKGVEGKRIAVKNASIRTTVSIGISAMPSAQIKSVDDLIRTADDALFKAKDGGRNQVVVAEQQAHAKSKSPSPF